MELLRGGKSQCSIFLDIPYRRASDVADDVDVPYIYVGKDIEISIYRNMDVVLISGGRLWRVE
jgi:coenzyme F420-reducing hydrogenase gamma subunit